MRAEALPAFERAGPAAIARQRVVARTGLSLRYVSLVRRGLRVPHRRWWAALAEAGAGPGLVPMPADNRLQHDGVN